MAIEYNKPEIVINHFNGMKFNREEFNYGESNESLSLAKFQNNAYAKGIYFSNDFLHLMEEIMIQVLSHK
jgi:hypothetical protein